ncbi:hypothetical protein E2C01_020369 [Portunus trituberculatus]|uniref:Uncharacterized protein n=1 Tax=Portunus trituberculatus TaxID=210409 RepID=A0A5B7DZK4_PORTR|nr:hypothetical protein [Portunus trituberculatus]
MANRSTRGDPHTWKTFLLRLTECEDIREIHRAGSSSLPKLPCLGSYYTPKLALVKFWISSIMRLRYHEALLLALAPPFPRLQLDPGFEAKTDTSTLSLDEHFISLQAGSLSHRKSSQPGLLMLLSIPPHATAVVFMPHSCFWTSPPGLLLSGSSPVHTTPVTQHAVSLHTTAVVQLFIILSLWC